MELLHEPNFDNKIWIINYSDYHKMYRVFRYSNPKDALAWVKTAEEACYYIQKVFTDYEIILIRHEEHKTMALLNGEIWIRKEGK